MNTTYSIIDFPLPWKIKDIKDSGIEIQDALRRHVLVLNYLDVISVQRFLEYVNTIDEQVVK